MLSIFKFFREINIIFNLMAKKTKQKNTYSFFYYPISTFVQKILKKMLYVTLKVKLGRLSELQ